MKSMIIEEAKGQEQKDEYPCLKRWEDDGFTVLFTGPNTGICVNPGSNDNRKLGDYDEEWSEELTVPLPPGTIVQLQND